MFAELLESRRLFALNSPIAVHTGIDSGTDPELKSTPQLYQDKKGRLIVLGTNGDDEFELQTGSFGFYVLYNGDNLPATSGTIDDSHITGVYVELGAGNDKVIDDQYGPVTAYGGSGNDTIITGQQDDFIDPGEGNDSVSAGGGDDTIAGEVIGPISDGNDFYDLGAGNDILHDAYGNNTILGGDGNDKIFTGIGNDSISGGLGNDSIRAGAGDDIIDGGGGRDRIFGQAGNDSIFGGNSNDTIVGGLGNDTLIGNQGDDLIYAGDPNAAEVPSAINLIDGGKGLDRLHRESAGDQIISVESLLVAVN